MSIDNDEYQAAFDKTIKAHPHAKIFSRKAKEILDSLNQKLARNYARDTNERVSYWELVRQTMNEEKLQGAEREAYKSLAGFYFSNRASKNRALAAHRNQPKSLPPVQIVMEGNQYTWKI